MKPLIVLSRIAFIGIIWSIFFIEGIRVMLLINWHFDIFNGKHWAIAYNLWVGGWTIRHSKEWAFVLIIVSFIPLWLTGWAALRLVPWENMVQRLCSFAKGLLNSTLNRPVAAIIKPSASTRSVQKVKSYKEVRPRSPRAMVESSMTAPAPLASAQPSLAAGPIKVEPNRINSSNKPPRSAPMTISAAPLPSTQPSNFDHSLFKFDDEEAGDFSFDIDAFDEKKEPVAEAAPAYTPPPPKKNQPPQKETTKERAPKSANTERNDRNKPNAAPKDTQPVKAGGNSVLDVIKQKGYEVITGTTIKNVTVDFIALSSKEIHIFLVDKEVGDWLADEERFNDEEPLWFSESSHRISPVRKIDIVRNFLQGKLKENDLRYNLKAHVVVALGNIINAEDMFDIWNDMNIIVSRIDRGSPKELKLFSKALPEAIDSINKDKSEKIRKLIKNIS